MAFEFVYRFKLLMIREEEEDGDAARACAASGSGTQLTERVQTENDKLIESSGRYVAVETNAIPVSLLTLEPQ